MGKNKELLHVTLVFSDFSGVGGLYSTTVSFLRGSMEHL
jgi:hypothetical protein